MLIKAKAFNRINNISGCLLFHNNRFLQLFEGETAKVNALNDRIQNDPRHRDITTHYNSSISNRLWDEWAMAFYEMSGSSTSLEIKREMLNNQMETAETVSGNKKAFQIFKEMADSILS